MATAQTVTCKNRTIKSKGYLNQMKRDGLVPGVVYGREQASRPIFVQGHELSRIFEKHGSRGLFSLEMEGEGNPAMALVREVQKHPVSGKIIHVDFLMVNMNEKIHSTVSIMVEGEDEVIKNDGILQISTKDLEILCMPQDLPEHILVDVSKLAIGHKLSVADLDIPAGLEITNDPDTVVVSVLAPSRAEEEEETEAAEGEEGTEAEAASKDEDK